MPSQNGQAIALIDAFGNALGNSIVDGMASKPTVQSDGIGLTDEQYADMNRQVEAGYRANQGQFNDQLQRDVRQQQLQLSLQRDITRSLDNNPEFVANLPMPRAEFVTPTPTISRQARLDRDLMKQAIAGGVGTSLFNRPIENAFDAQLLDALTPRAGTDPRTGLRVGPTHENAVALGLEPRVDYYPHITAEMRPWDPAADARAKLAGNAIGSMLMNPLGAVGYLGTLAAGGSEDVAFRNAIIGGAGGDVILGLGAPLGVRGPAALVRSTELEIAAAAGTRSPVLFGQRRLSETFGTEDRPAYLAGRTVSAVADDLAKGILHPDQLPITAFQNGGELVSANTRSLGALSEAGLLPTNVTLIKPTNRLLFRLQEPSLLPDSLLPGPRVPVTPSQRDLTILRIIEVPNQ